MKFLIFAFTIFLGAWSYAQSYGQLRIEVMQTNANHTTQVQLLVNQRALTKFAHSANRPIVVSLDRSHLNAQRPVTEVSASYENFVSGDPCEFDYSVSFSLNGSTWTRVGSFRALVKSSSDRTTIPIGLCDGQVCSSDARMQGAIEQQRLEMLRDRLKNIENNYDRKAARFKNLRDKAFTRTTNISDKMRFMGASLDRTRAEADTNKSKIDNSLASLAEQGKTETPSTGQDPNEVTAEALTKVQSEVASEQIAQDLDRALPNEAGELAEALEDPKLLQGLREQQNEVLDELSKEGSKKSTIEVTDLLEDFSLAKAQEYLITHPEVFKEAIAMGIRFTPAGDIIDACEAITGTENCLPGGRKLETSERIFAAAGVVVGNRAVWSAANKGVVHSISQGAPEAKNFFKVLKELSPARLKKGRSLSEVAVIGRDMDAVRSAAEKLKSIGIETRVFNTSADAMQELVTQGKRYADGKVPYELVSQTKAYRENMAWAKKVRGDNITVFDVGNPSKKEASRFYDDEISTFFKGAQ